MYQCINLCINTYILREAIRTAKGGTKKVCSFVTFFGMAPLRYLCLAITTRLSIQLKATQYSGNLLQLMLHVCAECEPTHLIVCINLCLQPACSQPCVEPLKPPAFLEDTLWYWSVYKFVCLLPMPTSWPSSIAWEPYDGTDGHLACCIKSPLANPLGQTKKQPLVKQIIPLKLRS